MSDPNWLHLLNNNTNGYVTTAIDATNDTAYDYDGASHTTVPDTINAVIATTESKQRIANVINNPNTFNMNDIIKDINTESITVYQTVLNNSADYLTNLSILSLTTGSGAIINASINENQGSIANVGVYESGSKYRYANITASGEGYTRGVPAVYFDPPTNTQATIAKAKAIVNNNGTVVAIDITDQGSGYTVNPKVTIQDPSGEGSAASATSVIRDGQVVEIIIDVEGSGYNSNSPPIVFIELPTRQAKAYCIVDTVGDYGISAVVLTDPGTGYTQTPNVVIADYNEVYRFTYAIKDIPMGNTEIQNSINSVTPTPNDESSLDTFLFEYLIGLNGNIEDSNVTITQGSIYDQLTNPNDPNSFFSQVWKLVDMFDKLFYTDIAAAKQYVKDRIASFGTIVNTKVQDILLNKSSLPHTIRTSLARVIANELTAYYLSEANKIVILLDSIMVTIEQLAAVADITFSVNKTGTYFMATSDNLYQLTQEFITTYKTITTGVTTKFFPSETGRQPFTGNTIEYLKQSTDSYIASVQGLVNLYKIYIDTAISETLAISNRLKKMHDAHLKDYKLNAPSIAEFIKQTLSLDQQSRIYTLSDDYLKSQTLDLYSFGENVKLLSSESLDTPPIIPCDLGLALFPSYETLGEAGIVSQPAYVEMTSGTSQWVSNLQYILPIFSVMTNTSGDLETLCNTINPITSLLWAKMYNSGTSYSDATNIINELNTKLNANGIDPFIHDVYPLALVQDTDGIKLTRLMSKIYFSWVVMQQNADSLAISSSKTKIAQFYNYWAYHIINETTEDVLITSMVDVDSDSYSILTNWFQLFNQANTLVDLVVLKYIPQTVPTSADSSFSDIMTNILSDIQSNGLQHAIDDGSYTYFKLSESLTPTPAAISYETIQTNVYNIHQGLFMFMTLLMQSSFSIAKFKSGKSRIQNLTPPFKVTKNSGIRLNTKQHPTPIPNPTPQTTPTPAPVTKNTKVRVAHDWKRRSIR